MADLPLRGLRVVDFGIGGVGPWAASQLGQLGAQVIKVEAPNEFILKVMPPWRGLTTTYACLNLTKRSVELNLKEDRDVRRAWSLLRSVDVVVENFRSGAMERLGLGFGAVAERNPRVVYCSSSGFGGRGEMAGLPCTDPHMQAFSGFASLNGHQPTGERLRYYAAVDLYTSALIVEAVLAGLVERERSGEPQRIEMTMLGAATSLLVTQCAAYLAGGEPPRPRAGRSGHVAPDGLYRTADGAIAVTAETDEEFAACCRAAGLDEVAAAERFATADARLARAEELDHELAPAFAARPTDWWLAALGRAGVACARVHLDHELLAHRDAWGAGHLRPIGVDGSGGLVGAGPPWDFEGVAPAPATAPRPGQDTDLLTSDETDPWEALA